MSSLRSEAFNAIVHHAYRPKGIEDTIFYITDKIIVRFKQGTTLEQINSLLEKYSLKVLMHYEDQPNTYLLQVTSSSQENPIKIANHIVEENNDIVEFAEPNRAKSTANKSPMHQKN